MRIAVKGAATTRVSSGTAGQAMTTAHLQGGLTVRVTVPGAVNWMRPPGGGLFRGVVLGA